MIRRMKPLKLRPIPRTALHAYSMDWPEDYADGENCYLCFCASCYSPFFGHKRRVQCRICANKITWFQRIRALFRRKIRPQVNVDLAESRADKTVVLICDGNNPPRLAPVIPWPDRILHRNLMDELQSDKATWNQFLNGDFSLKPKPGGDHG